MNMYEENLKNYVGFSDKQMKEVKALVKDISDKTNKGYNDTLEIVYKIARACKGDKEIK